MTTNKRGNKEHHYSKDNIEWECLEEAKTKKHLAIKVLSL